MSQSLDKEMEGGAGTKTGSPRKKIRADFIVFGSIRRCISLEARQQLDLLLPTTANSGSV